MPSFVCSFLRPQAPAEGRFAIGGELRGGARLCPRASRCCSFSAGQPLPTAGEALRHPARRTFLLSLAFCVGQVAALGGAGEEAGRRSSAAAAAAFSPAPSGQPRSSAAVPPVLPPSPVPSGQQRRWFGRPDAPPAPLGGVAWGRDWTRSSSCLLPPPRFGNPFCRLEKASELVLIYWLGFFETQRRSRREQSEVSQKSVWVGSHGGLLCRVCLCACCCPHGES